MDAPINTPSQDELTDWDREHHLHPWASTDGWRNDDYMRVNTADGIYLWDDAGKRYIDGPGGMWCVQIGYGRTEMAEAIAKQAIEMPYASPWSFTTEPAAILAQQIAERAPGDLNTVHFTTGGSTAVDTAIRAVQFLNNRMGRPEKKIIIAREKGYHGSTYLASTVTGKERFKTKFDNAIRSGALPAGREPLSPPRGHEHRGLVRRQGRGSRGPDHKGWRRPDRRLHRRTDPLFRRRDRTAGGLSPAHMGGLPEARHPLYLGRGRDRLRPTWATGSPPKRCSGSNPTSSPAPRG